MTLIFNFFLQTQFLKGRTNEWSFHLFTVPGGDSRYRMENLRPTFPLEPVCYELWTVQAHTREHTHCPAWATHWVWSESHFLSATQRQRQRWSPVAWPTLPSAGHQAALPPGWWSSRLFQEAYQGFVLENPFPGSQFLEVLFPHTSLLESMSGFIIILPVLESIPFTLHKSSWGAIAPNVKISISRSPNRKLPLVIQSSFP